MLPTLGPRVFRHEPSTRHLNSSRHSSLLAEAAELALAETDTLVGGVYVFVVVKSWCHVPIIHVDAQLFSDSYEKTCIYPLTYARRHVEYRV